MTNDLASPSDRPKRNLVLRILFGFLWFVVFFFLTNILVGGIVGGIAGASAKQDSGTSISLRQSFEAGKDAGQVASADFFNTYGLIVFLAQVLVFVLLCYFALIPGVSKYRKVKNA